MRWFRTIDYEGKSEGVCVTVLKGAEQTLRTANVFPIADLEKPPNKLQHNAFTPELSTPMTPKFEIVRKFTEGDHRTCPLRNLADLQC